MVVSKIFLDISGKLQDVREPRRWQWENTNPAAPSFLDYLNNAVAQIVSLRPDATAVTAPITLVQGFKQSIPTTAQSLLNLLYNTDEDGTVGKPVRQSKFKTLVGMTPSVGTYIDCYAYDKLDDPKTFWVYPHVPVGGLSVMATVSNKPSVIASKTDTFPLEDKFVSPATHWVLYEIYSGDNTDTDLARAQHHYEAFMTELDIVIKADKQFPAKPKEGNK
jgi:hypothetical protein